MKQSIGVVAGAGSATGRMRLKSGAKSLGYADRAGQLPRVSLSTLLPALPAKVVLHEPVAGAWNVELYELVVLSALAQHCQPRAIFEMGTYDGRTTLNLAAAAEQAEVYTLDLPPTMMTYPDGVTLGCRFKGRPEAARIRQLLGPSMTSDLSAYFGQMDFVFVDADHGYHAVRNDSQLALKLLRGGKGVILWHDYATFAGPTRALDELYRSGGVWSGLCTIEKTTLACLRIS